MRLRYAMSATPLTMRNAGTIKMSMPLSMVCMKALTAAAAAETVAGYASQAAGRLLKQPSSAQLQLGREDSNLQLPG